MFVGVNSLPYLLTRYRCTDKLTIYDIHVQYDVKSFYLYLLLKYLHRFSNVLMLKFHFVKPLIRY